jgi:predicted nuclease of predicted toxin-antitoxin system
MRLLLDECLPRKLKRRFPAHEVKTVPEMGWSGLKNGELLTLAETQFDVFITADQNLPYQQNLIGRKIAVLILMATDNRLETLSALVPAAETALATVWAGEVVAVGGPDPAASP